MLLSYCIYWSFFNLAAFAAAAMRFCAPLILTASASSSSEALIGASSSSFFLSCLYYYLTLELRLTTSNALIGVAYAPPTSPFAFRAACTTPGERLPPAGASVSTGIVRRKWAILIQNNRPSCVLWVVLCSLWEVVRRSFAFSSLGDFNFLVGRKYLNRSNQSTISVSSLTSASPPSIKKRTMENKDNNSQEEEATTKRFRCIMNESNHDIMTQLLLFAVWIINPPYNTSNRITCNRYTYVV